MYYYYVSNLMYFICLLLFISFTVIESISINVGSLAGGTLVILYGSGFGSVLAFVNVHISGTHFYVK